MNINKNTQHSKKSLRIFLFIVFYPLTIIIIVKLPEKNSFVNNNNNIINNNNYYNFFFFDVTFCWYNP